jgi:hypothetical protein
MIPNLEYIAAHPGSFVTHVNREDAVSRAKVCSMENDGRVLVVYQLVEVFRTQSALSTVPPPRYA